MCAKYIDLKEMETLEVDEKNHEFKFDLKEVTGHEAGIFIFADNSVSVGFWGESRECSSHYNEDLDYVLECTVTDLEEVCEQIQESAGCERMANSVVQLICGMM